MGSAPFHLPREKYGSPKGTSVFTLNQSLFFSKIGVCFFFFKSEFVFFFFENRSLLFENRSLFFWKSGFDFWKLEFVLKKIGVCSFQNRSLFFENPSIGPRFCAVILLWSSNKISGRSMEGTGESGPPLSLDQTEAQKHFLETAPLLISGSGWPPPLPLIWRSLFQFFDKNKVRFSKNKLRFQLKQTPIKH